MMHCKLEKMVAKVCVLASGSTPKPMSHISTTRNTTRWDLESSRGQVEEGQHSFNRRRAALALPLLLYAAPASAAAVAKKSKSIDSGDWSSPGLAAPVDEAMPK
jgi:hypothetical protein